MEQPASPQIQNLQSRLPYLLIVKGVQLNYKIELDLKRLEQKPLVFGRQAGAVDVVLQSHSGLVSRRHTLFYFRPDDQMLVIEDAGSSNGTKLNGSLLIGATPLIPGDYIQIGDVELVFLLPGTPVPPPFRKELNGNKTTFPEDNLPGLASLEILTSTLSSKPSGSFCRLTPIHVFKIGRHSSCDLRLIEQGDQGYTISRQQAEIRYGNGSYVLRDSGSAFPTLLNKQELKDASSLKDGDTIQIGTTVLRFRAPRKAWSPASGRSLEPGKKVNLLPLAILIFSSNWRLHTGPYRIILPLDKPILVGRGKETLLRLNDPSVSRLQAKFEYDITSQHYTVTDLGSTNGTFKNGQETKGVVELNSGDQIKFGEFNFIFSLIPPENFASDGLPRESGTLLTNQVTLTLALGEGGLLAPSQPAEDPLFNQDNRSSAVLKSSQIFDSKLIERLIQGESLNKTLSGQSSRVQRLLDQGKEGLNFEEITEQVGFKVTVGGNQPFLLDDKEAVWLIKSGSVEVFVVQVEQGQMVNARYHVCSVPAGQALFCQDPDQVGEGLSLLAVPAVSTELISLTLSDFRTLAQSEVFLLKVIALLDQWLGHLSEDITRNILTSKLDQLLQPGQEVEVQSFEKIGTKKEGVWVRILQDNFLFLGEQDLNTSSKEVLLPVYGSAWLLCLAPSRVVTTSSSILVRSDDIWSNLDLFYDLFFQVKLTSIRLTTFDEINRLRQKTEYDSLLEKQSRQALSEILDQKEASDVFEPFGQNRDHLLACCQLVGAAQGIEIKDAPQYEQAEQPVDRLKKVMRASRVRYREIELPDEWWTRNNGPIFAYSYPGKNPVALLPVRKKGLIYNVINPADNTTLPVTPELAPTFNSTGFVFYRPLPAVALKGKDLLAFGFKGSRRDFIITLLLGIAGGLIGLFVPLITGYIFDKVIPSADRPQALQILVTLIVVAFSIASFQLTRSITLLRLETRLDVSLQAAIWDRLLELPVPFFRNYSTGDLANRALSIDAIRQILSSTVITAILSSIFSLFSFALLFTYDLGLAFVALALTIITLVTILCLSLWQLSYQRNLTALHGKLTGVVLQLITGISKVRTAGAEIRAFSVWVKIFTRQRRANYKARTIGNLLTIFNSVWPTITFIVLFLAIDSFKNRTFTTGTFLSFIAAFTQFLTAMTGMAGAFITALHIIPYYERAKPIFETLPEVSSDKIDPGELSGAIEINQISFRYSPESPKILDDISLNIKAGEFIAIVGPSGSGKSSLFRLLLGFEKPETGSIYFDNQDLKNLDVQSVRRQMGVVNQNGKLMSGDIFTNIVGSGLFTFEDAWEAARLAGLNNDLEEMPMGMFTIISDGGSTLSGGQRQRLMIARAIISRPRILLFDEATSALDNQTQAIVSSSLESLRATRFVIAHRLSTVINADRILVMVNGKIVQSGNYNELVNSEGPFLELVRRQLV